MLTRSAAFALFAAITATAQQSAAPAFDVASVKVATGVRRGGYTHRITPTSLTMLHVSMGHCLRLAYDIRTAYELVGPAWLDPPTFNEYDVVAKVDHPVSEDQIRAMLRMLLATRFGLRAHRETRDLPVYLLEVSKPMAALRNAAGTGKAKRTSCEKPYCDRFTNYSMAQLALELGPPMTARPVIDRTNLSGTFDFELDISHYVLDPETGKPVLDYRGAIDTESAVVHALPQQLGLTLKPARAPYLVLVVDHVAKTPSEN